MSIVTTGLWKGCLGGLGLAFGFLIISLVVLLILSQTALPPKVILFITIASGPIIGTFGFAAAILLFRARAGKRGQGLGIRD